MPLLLDIEYEAFSIDVLKVARSLYSAMTGAFGFICALLVSAPFHGNGDMAVQATSAQYLLGLGE
jgi:hypothetical protein